MHFLVWCRACGGGWPLRHDVCNRCTHLLALIAGWHREGRTIMLVSHDFDQVRATTPEALLLAREPVAWGPVDTVLTPANLAKARTMSEAWDERARPCDRRAS